MNNIIIIFLSLTTNQYFSLNSMADTYISDYLHLITVQFRIDVYKVMYSLFINKCNRFQIDDNNNTVVYSFCHLGLDRVYLSLDLHTLNYNIAYIY